MKAIIYRRKSTDRDDRQANSLEHQLKNCQQVMVSNNFELVEDIYESRSAKIEKTRPGFNRLLKLCKTGKIDYIVIDEAKRLSRNNMDSAKIVDLMDKNQIKGVYASGRTYLSHQPNDIFLLQLDLSISKMDNGNRSKDVREKMQTCIEKHGRFLGKTPFGYKNITIKKGYKDIIVNKREAQVVKEIFNMRLENKAYSTIAQIIKEKYGTTLDIAYTAQRMQKLVQKKFYYGVFIWGEKEIQGRHKPLITKEIYDKANNIGRGVHQKKNRQHQVKRAYRKYPLKGLVKDISGIYLTSYTKKGHIYYGNQYRSNERVSINETKLFSAIGEYIKQNEGRNEVITSIDKDIILELLKKDQVNYSKDLIRIDEDIEKLKIRQDRLLDMQLDNKISEEKYLEKNNKIENDIKELQDQKEALKNDDFTQKTQVMLELAGSFYQSYFRANEEGKIEIIKKLMLELFVTNKKELQVEESPLFQSSKMLKCSFGTATENRTPVAGMRIPSPNH